MMFGSPPTLSLRPWKQPLEESWVNLRSQAEQITERAGQGAAFEKLVHEAQALIDGGELNIISERMTEKRFCRALATIWSSDDERAKASLGSTLLDALIASIPVAPLTRQTIALLATTYLKHFDSLDSWQEGLRQTFANALRSLVDTQAVRERGADVIEEVRQAPSFYLAEGGPRLLAKDLVQDDSTLERHLRAFGGSSLAGTRYFSRVRHWLYVEQIRVADPTEDHNFLYEIRDPMVYGVSDDDGLLFGHTLLRELVSRSSDLPGNTWLETILDIGGDPRLRHTDKFRSWWGLLPDEYARAVIRWLSAEDLKMFLLAVEEFGDEEGVDSLQRLFPARKTFMWGLYETGLVRETRLIVGDNVKAGLRRYLGKSVARSSFATYESDDDTAIIFLDCGDFHIVEGSHNFRLWVYMGEPDAAITNRARQRFSRNDFIRAIPARRDLHQHGPHRAFRHQGFWQREPIYFLASQGVALDIEALLTRDDYTLMKSRYGLPRLRR